MIGGPEIRFVGFADVRGDTRVTRRLGRLLYNRHRNRCHWAVVCAVMPFCPKRMASSAGLAVGFQGGAVVVGTTPPDREVLRVGQRVSEREQAAESSQTSPLAGTLQDGQFLRKKREHNVLG